MLKSLALALGLLVLPAAAALSAPIRVALDWTPNTNHVGLYVAQAMGWYKDAGLEVEILPYSDTSAGTLIANGVAQFGVVSTLGLYTQRAAGADLVGTYAVVQSETGRLVFDGKRKDITRPRDLDGKIYAGFGSAWEEALLRAMIRHDGGKGEVQMMTLGTAAYDALASGRVDFTLEVMTWEGVKADLDGRPQGAFRYADYGVPDEHTTLIAARGSWLADHAAEARAFLSATRRGYAFAVENPDRASDLLIEASGGLLADRALTRASLQALIDGHYLRAEDGTIGRMDPARMAGMAAYLFKAGVLKDGTGKVLQTAPDAQAGFSNDYLE